MGWAKACTSLHCLMAGVAAYPVLSCGYLHSICIRKPAVIACLILQVIGVIFLIIGMMLVYFSFIVKGAGKDTES